MTEYEFTHLNDKEFEVLAVDLLSKKFNVQFERFKDGRDKGVDGRYFHQDGSEDIVQCKHWKKSTFSTLLRNLKKIELPKIKKLNPKRYILVVSQPLSRDNKNKIMEALDPFIKAPTDIIGQEDLNDLLANHPSVEKRHYKLWIGSTNVLSHLFNKPIHDRSLFELTEILERCPLYVETINHQQAINKIENLGCVIITGPPGIGKTTLAEHLVLEYFKEDYSLVLIADNIHEAESAFIENEKQVFYFDDFLGSNYLSAINGHEGTHIVRFMRRVKRDKTKKFILTSRSVILNQGKILNDSFKTNNLDQNELEVSIGSLSELDRARILYNHIWHSDLLEPYIDQIYLDKRYRIIIDHKNFNPRLISYITNNSFLQNIAAENYWDYITDLLDNPAKVWEHPFEAQIDAFGRSLVLLTTLNRQSLSQTQLSEAFARFVNHEDSGSLQGIGDFTICLKHLAGSMLTRIIGSENQATIELFNPSIGDFILNRYSNDSSSLRAGFGSLRTVSSIYTIRLIVDANIIDVEKAIDILSHILSKASENEFSGYNPNYLTLVCNSLIALDRNNWLNHNQVQAVMALIINNDCPENFGEEAELCRWARESNVANDDQVIKFIEQASELRPSFSEIKELLELSILVDDSFREQLDSITDETIIEYLSDEIYNEVSDDEIFDGLNLHQIDDAKWNLERKITELVHEFGISLTTERITEISDHFDLKFRMSQYFSDEQDYEPITRNTTQMASIEQIDDLFEKC